MITIRIIGLDQFDVGDLSKKLTPNLAKVYETSESEINFVAPRDTMLFHNGVDQSLWNCIVQVKAPHRCEAVESFAADILMAAIKEVAINVAIEFTYYEEAHRYEYLNNEFDRFIEAPISRADYDEDEDDDELDDLDDLGLEDEEEDDEFDDIYDGDVFKEHGIE
ncbi:MAG: hypothetical protein LUC31_02520 [Coprobacillus sp.]|nr:hypothetical protein [Coprobacillus sp.]